MEQTGHHLRFLRQLTWVASLLVVAVLIGYGLLVLLARLLVARAAENAPSHRRLVVLRAAPIARLIIAVAGLALIIPILVEPTFEDIVALLATVGLALAFAVKDYVSCLIAGVVTILENTYQPGDWIRFDGHHGEVKAIGTRAVHIVTADDSKVIIPHAKLWSTSISHDSQGTPSVLTATNFYLDADDDGDAVRQFLTEIAEANAYRKSDSPVQVTAAETPWGAQYRVKAYAAESREQFAMITDLTLRAKARLRAMNVAFARAPYSESQARPL